MIKQTFQDRDGRDRTGNVIEVEDGKILREREYYDNLAIMRQLGVVD